MRLPRIQENFSPRCLLRFSIAGSPYSPQQTQLCSLVRLPSHSLSCRRLFLCAPSLLSLHCCFCRSIRTCSFPCRIYGSRFIHSRQCSRMGVLYMNTLILG